MTKTYEGLVNALRTSENIIQANKGIEWKKLHNILLKDPIIEPYYFDVLFIILAGRDSLRFESMGENKHD